MYADREQAGQALAAQLSGYADRDDVIVLGLVRGGVPVAAKVAAVLHAPLDVLVVRKLGVPWAPEVAFGALGPRDVIVHNESTEAMIPADDVAKVVEVEQAEMQRREAEYRAGRQPLDLTGRTAIVVDDGIATGATARAAIAAARALGAARVVLAVPVASPEAVRTLSQEADEVVCPLTPADFMAVSRFYERFDQTSDDEVVSLLAAAAR